MKDRPRPQDGAICHPPSRRALDSTREKSKRKTERDLAMDSRKRGASRMSQLGSVREESKRQTAAAVSGNGLLYPKARAGVSE